MAGTFQKQKSVGGTPTGYILTCLLKMRLVMRRWENFSWLWVGGLEQDDRVNPGTRTGGKKCWSKKLTIGASYLPFTAIIMVGLRFTCSSTPTISTKHISNLPNGQKENVAAQLHLLSLLQPYLHYPIPRRGFSDSV